MPGKVTLEVTHGPLQGQVFAFEEHDTFVLGRDSDCHAKLPEEDLSVSRHHFILEVNPPYVRIRDLGSLNGTYVNDTLYGGRLPDEAPEEAAKRTFPAVDLRDGDRIQAGETIFRVAIDLPVFCEHCGIDIPDTFKSLCRFEGGVYTCPGCVETEQQRVEAPISADPIRCKHCGKDVTAELGGLRRGDYICSSCRSIMESDPIQGLLGALVGKFKRNPLAKSRIPGYEVVDKLGRSGMGSVYLARRDRDGAEVALKVMMSKVTVYEQSRDVFKREIEVTMRLRHPNIVLLLDHGSVGSIFYFIMEYCPGGSVESLMQDHGGKLHLDVALPILQQALEGLAYAHAQGVVHRDLNPRNILLTARQNGVAKIADLGLAKNFQQAGFSGMTVTGVMVGTPPLIPREQLLNFKYVKPVSDVWSMAAVFYNMLTGEIPYENRNGLSPLDIVFEGRVISLRDRRRDIPGKLAEVVDRALAVKVADRYQTAEEFRNELLRATGTIDHS